MSQENEVKSIHKPDQMQELMELLTQRYPETEFLLVAVSTAAADPELNHVFMSRTHDLDLHEVLQCVAETISLAQGAARIPTAAKH